MILEAKQMLESLESAGWDLSVTHPDLKRPGKAYSILANLSPEGDAVTSIKILRPDETALRWNQANGGHNNFPVNKIKGPYLAELNKTELVKLTRERSDEKRTAILEELFQEHGPIPLPQSPFTEGLQTKLEERRTMLEPVLNSTAHGYLNLLKVTASCPPERGAELLHQILKHLTNLASEGNGDIRRDAQKILITLLFTPKAKAAVPIVWNLPGEGLNERDSSSPANFASVNEALLKADVQHESGLIVCSLTGGDVPGVGEKYPQPTFPAVGKTYLFSRNKQTPSMSRYGINGTDSYQIGEVPANQLAAALSALTQPDRENKTWINIPSDKPKKSDLLIVFQAGLKDHEIARAIGDAQTAVGESHFEELTRRVIDRAAGRNLDKIRGQMLLTVLSAVDPGNRKMIFHKSIDLETLELAGVSWTKACKSLKGRKLPLPFATGEPPKQIGEVVISPGAIPALTRSCHFIDGRVSPDTPGGFTFGESLDLLLALGTSQKSSLRLLTIAYGRLGSLLARIAALYYSERSEVYKLKTTEKWTCLKAQSLFSILLVSLHRPPEKTMNSIAYQLGQLCASFDILHAAYCHIERKGQLPPRLIGNSCFQASSRNPIAALGQLSSRAAPYLSRLRGFNGAKAEQFLAQVKSDKNATSAIWDYLKLKNHLSTSAQKLATALNSDIEGVNDLFRCELLLGYLSGPDFPEKSESISTTNQTTES